MTALAIALQFEIRVRFRCRRHEMNRFLFTIGLSLTERRKFAGSNGNDVWILAANLPDVSGVSEKASQRPDPCASRSPAGICKLKRTAGRIEVRQYVVICGEAILRVRRDHLL